MLNVVPELHDGYVKSLPVDGAVAVLGLASKDRCRFELRLEGVEGLHTEDFGLLNIIYSLEWVCGTPPPWLDLPELLGRLFPAPHASVDLPYGQRHADLLQGVLNRISGGDATMVVLRRSLGCELVAVCRTLQLIRLEIPGTTDPGSPHLLSSPEQPR